MDEWRGVILFSFSAAKLSSKAKLVFERRRIADSLVNSWRDKRPRRERTGLAFVPSFNRAIYSRDPCKIFTPPPTGILLRYFFPGDGPISLLLFRFCPLPFHYFVSPVSCYSNHHGGRDDISPWKDFRERSGSRLSRDISQVRGEISVVEVGRWSKVGVFEARQRPEFRQFS